MEERKGNCLGKFSQEKRIRTFRTDDLTEYAISLIRKDLGNIDLSDLLNRGLLSELQKLDKDEKRKQELRELQELQEFEARVRIALRKSRTTMIVAGWAVRIRKLVKRWVEENDSLPPKAVIEGWTNCGLAYGYSKKQVKKIVVDYINSFKVESRVEFVINGKKGRRSALTQKRKTRQVC